MSIIPLVYAEDAGVSKLDNPTFFKGDNLASLLTGGGFNLVTFIFALIGLSFLVSLIMAGWDYLLSSGDPKKVAAASSRLLNSLIGLVICFSAFLIVNLITTMIGLGSQF